MAGEIGEKFSQQIKISASVSVKFGITLCLPRAHTQGVKQSVLSVVVIMKIARSGVLSICSYCNYHELADIGEKLVSVRFELLNKAH